MNRKPGKAFLSVLLLALFSCASSAMAAEKQAPKGVVVEIVDALVRDGKVQADCAKGQPNKAEIVSVKLVRLTKGDEDQYLVEGSAPCAFGARDPMFYVYGKTDGKYRLLADIGATGTVEVSKKTTNGWRDIICHYTYAAGTKSGKSVYKFNGRSYVLQR